jgi:Putative MetA-pathway of phenol degradation
MRGRMLLFAFLAALAGGCATLPAPVTARGQSPSPVSAAARGDDPKGENEKGDKAKDAEKKKDGKAPTADAKKENGDQKDQDEKGKDRKEKGPPKTLFEWAIGPDVEEAEDEPKPLSADRPDFTQASSTVGLGRAQLEAGYTYTRDRTGGASRVTHTYPEAILRVGVLADWFEMRLGESYTHSRTTFVFPVEHEPGLDDLYVGVKLGLTEQRAFLPEMAMILQATVPTGVGFHANDRILPGGNLLYGWDVVKDVLDAAGMSQASVVAGDDGHSFVEWAQSFTVGYRPVRELRAYAEWYVLSPTGATAPGVTARHYFDTGLTYWVTPDLAADVRVGWGLSRGADDFFVGAGFSVRY